MSLAHWLKSLVQDAKYSFGVFHVSTQITWNTKTLNLFVGKLGLLQGGCIKTMGLYSVSEHVWNQTQKTVAVGLDETN